jgi:hypothetical protein
MSTDEGILKFIAVTYSQLTIGWFAWWTLQY